MTSAVRTAVLVRMGEATNRSFVLPLLTPQAAAVPTDQAALK